MMIRLTKLFSLGLLLCTTLVNAEVVSEFVPPDTLEFNQITYHLTDSGEVANRKMFEYMVEGETVDAWQSLITISFFEGAKSTASQLRQTQEKSLNMTDILLRQFIVKKDRLYTMIAYKPVDPTGSRLEETAYEANVGKAFFNNQCHGITVFEYSKRIPGETPNIKQVMQTNLHQIYQALSQSSWQPVCSS